MRTLRLRHFASDWKLALAVAVLFSLLGACVGLWG